jgi:hypothetical protein
MPEAGRIRARKDEKIIGSSNTNMQRGVDTQQTDRPSQSAPAAAAVAILMQRRMRSESAGRISSSQSPVSSNKGRSTHEMDEAS